jgi:hypothetical protein
MWAIFSALVQTGSGAHPASFTMGTGSLPVVKSGRGVTLTPQPLLVPWSWKSRAITLLPLWAVRPIQNLSACTRVNFTFYVRYVKHKIYTKIFKVLCKILNNKQMKKCRAEQPKKGGYSCRWWTRTPVTKFVPAYNLWLVEHRNDSFKLKNCCALRNTKEMDRFSSQV